MKLKKAVGIKEFLRKKFTLLPIPEEWAKHFGELPERFTMGIYGFTGNGKTDYAIKIAKMLSAFGNVLYNSPEQGVSKSLQMCIDRNNMDEVKGKVIFVCDTYEELVLRLDKRKSARFVFLDSRDQMNLTTEQFYLLEKKFPKKSFIVLLYEKGAKPKGEHGISILFRCDIKMRVRLFIAMGTSRFGGGEDYMIWEKGAKDAREKIKALKQLETK